jgi:hypothetical protein
MSLLKSYTIEGGYQYGRQLSENFLHASIVDSTSSYNLAGGLYYTYHVSDPPGAAPAGHGHEAGFALSLPFGEMVALGATIKYFRLVGDDAGAGNNDGGFTFDLGATVHPTPILSLGLVGTNLHDLGNGQAAQGVGYGVAFVPTPNLLVVADGRTTFTADNHTGRKGTSVMLGGEYTLAQKVGFRAGGGYDASTGNGYLTAGVSGISEVGAFDAGFRQDVSQHQDALGVVAPRQTVVGISLRLFVPAAQTQQPLQ